ncbi:DUF1295 domain-containing protein [Aurantiacibacter gangjinensis]|uniref:Membrane protein n=1 Tax=Aurantiacibacter gangjinensis TaxID=502682 RepID=A0A0G9ML04_9SPHN|nr:DUF1295 domain-containing protein [Aurantiacibacter gangjinensis]APE27251.1 Hypothetical protein BMF35_a0422 [Aurantiacibacter gangjinensis]KLE31370.1 membrane protein [Aurantiacibacter gangjinensis]
MIEALGLNAAIWLAAALGFWLISLAIRKVSFVDSVWGFGMAVLATLSWWQLDQRGTLATLLLVMVVAWGVRLGIHLLRRFLRNGEDERYKDMLADAREKGHWDRTALWKVWLLQSVLLFAVCSPAQVGILAAGPTDTLSWLSYLGLALYLTGIFFEWVGDWQLARFKASDRPEGEVLDSGLWRYTRHPNYFGDACAWWGIWLVAMSVDTGVVIWTIIGPIFLTFTLVKWSGAALTEEGMSERYGDEYERYKARTSAFIPMPPSEKEG